jgi:hypothetical protein
MPGNLRTVIQLRQWKFNIMIICFYVVAILQIRGPIFWHIAVPKTKELDWQYDLDSVSQSTSLYLLGQLTKVIFIRK